jgi:hypothetical protein
MVAELTASYVHFATNDGQTHDVGTIVMLAGPVLIGLLAMYFVYNVTAAVVNGVRTVGGFALRLVRPARTAPVVALPVVIAEPETATIYMVTSAA